MLCTKCKSEVSIADKRCSKCNADLLYFGAMTSSLQLNQRSSLSTGVKKINNALFLEVNDEIEQLIQTSSSDALEIAVMNPLLDDFINRLKARYESDDEIEAVFETQIAPALDHMQQEDGGREMLREVEDSIRAHLGEDVSLHYQDKGDEVLKILRSGEIAVQWMNLLAQADLSVILFPFFKAAERACHIHIEERYTKLKGHRQIEEIESWLPDKKHVHVLHIEDNSGWLEQHKRKIIEVVRGLLKESKSNDTGARATGVGIQLFGRTWLLKIKRTDKRETKTFHIENLLNATGSENEKATLARNLDNLQELRNKRVHEKVEENQHIIRQVRDLAYDCLKGLPAILRI